MLTPEGTIMATLFILEENLREPKNNKAITKKRYWTKQEKLDKCSNRVEKLFFLSAMLEEE